jgi:pyrophosphate--fructose-6-phosphate 1-phosphotransferase
VPGLVPVSFGFDTAAKTYAEFVGNLQLDALSSQKYYHFVRLMGRSASHIALEVALQTQPNLVFIGEEVAREGYSLKALTDQLANVVVARAKAGKHFGVVVVPEGLVEFVPEVRA